jgi:hypothetical protein
MTSMSSVEKEYQRQIQILKQDLSENVKSIQKVLAQQEDIARLKASWTQCLED